MILEFILQSTRWEEEKERTCAVMLLADPAENPNRLTWWSRPLPREPDRRWYETLFREDSGLARSACSQVPLNDPEICRIAGCACYESMKRDLELSSYSLESLKRLGWTVCEGLGVQYCRNRTGKRSVFLQNLMLFLEQLPGDSAARQKEGQAVWEWLARRGELPAGGMKALEEFIRQL